MTPSSKPTPGTDLSDEEAAGRPERAGGATAAQILIVEDDFLISLELELRLIDAGFSVVGIAVTAGEAVSMAGSERPELAVMGIRLADRTDGVEAAHHPRHSLDLCLGPRRRRNAQARRARLSVGWLQKPYPAEALIRLIPAYLSDPSA